MRRIVLGVRYDGHPFEGWQTQPHGNTVQDHLETAVAAMAGHSIKTYCAGRTDAGVHARGQVVHFDTDAHRPMAAWVRGVNAHLNGSIRITGALELPAIESGFHARFSAVSRCYRYHFYAAKVADPFKSKMTWVHYPVDISAMREAARLILGTHDFSAFRAAQCQANSPVKCITKADFVKEADHVYFEIQGNAFLHHMVRNLMGSLMEVGLGRQNIDWFKSVFDSKDRKLASKTYPAQGLVLWSVDYPQEYNVASVFDTSL